MEATEMFLVRHKRLHAQVDRILEGLGEEQIREPVQPTANPIAWIVWHIARAEDSAVNRLIFSGSEVLDADWNARLNVGRGDAGTGMTKAEVLDLSARVNLSSLIEYWSAVGERTAELVPSLSPANLDEIVGTEQVHRFVAQMTQEPARTDLDSLWQNTSRGHFLVWLPLTHNYEHVGQIDLIRGVCGQPGRF